MADGAEARWLSLQSRAITCPDSPLATTCKPGLKTHNLPLTIPPPTVPAAFSFFNLFFSIIDMPKPHRHADKYTAQDIPDRDGN